MDAELRERGAADPLQRLRHRVAVGGGVTAQPPLAEPQSAYELWKSGQAGIENVNLIYPGEILRLRRVQCLAADPGSHHDAGICRCCDDAGKRS